MNNGPKEINNLIGVRWKRGGRSIEEGLDCLGVVLEVCRLKGLPFFDLWDTWSRRYREGWRAFGETFVPAGWQRHGGDLDDGCIVVMADDDGIDSHVAIIVEGRLLTSYVDTGVVWVELSAGLRGRITSIWTRCAE